MTTIISGLISHQFEGRNVRTSSNDQHETLFVARDVFEALDIAWRGLDSIGFLDPDEFVTTEVIDSLNRAQQTILLTESGLSATIFQSRKPEAKRFRKWVTSEVLPALRKTGSYTTPGAAVDAGYVVKGSGAERIERLRALLQIERGLHLYETRRDAVLRGEAVATPAVHVEGAVTVQPFLLAELPHLPMPRIRTLVQIVVGRLQRSGRPLGRILENSHWQRTARPDDIRSVIPPADLAGAKGGA